MGEGIASHWNGSAGPALGLIALARFLVLLAENSRVPVDDPNIHLELTMVHEVMVLDHSGPDFGYILYASALKIWLFATLIVGLLLPFHTGSPISDSAVFLVGILAMALAVGEVESSMARLRMIYVPHLLLGAAVLAAMSVTLALAIR
jgi:formate hydrogenlyase subunit 4